MSERCPADGKTRNYHMCMSVTGPLANWPLREWKRALKYINKDDGTPFRSVEELKRSFLDELAKGHKVIPMGECDNFDWEQGCMGHLVEEETTVQELKPEEVGA